MNKLDEKIREVFAEFGKRGGKKGMAGRTAKERKDLAKKAADARWAGIKKKSGKKKRAA